MNSTIIWRDYRWYQINSLTSSCLPNTDWLIKSTSEINGRRLSQRHLAAIALTTKIKTESIIPDWSLLIISFASRLLLRGAKSCEPMLILRADPVREWPKNSTHTHKKKKQKNKEIQSRSLVQHLASDKENRQDDWPHESDINWIYYDRNRWILPHWPTAVVVGPTPIDRWPNRLTGSYQRASQTFDNININWCIQLHAVYCAFVCSSSSSGGGGGNCDGTLLRPIERIGPHHQINITIA